MRLESRRVPQTQRKGSGRGSKCLILVVSEGLEPSTSAL
jgi:hypothetical protein